MLGLLHLLWENTGLNEWAPWLEGKRRLTTVMARLQKEASSIKQGRTVLGDVLLLQGNEHTNKKAVNYACANSRRLIVISELNEWSPALIAGNNLPLIGTTKISPPAGMPYLTINNSRWENSLARFTAMSHGGSMAVKLSPWLLPTCQWRENLRSQTAYIFPHMFVRLF